MTLRFKFLFSAFILLGFNLQAQVELNFESIMMNRDSVTIKLDSSAFGYLMQLPEPEDIVVFYDREEGIDELGVEVMDEVMVCFAVVWKGYLAECVEYRDSSQVTFRRRNLQDQVELEGQY